MNVDANEQQALDDIEKYGCHIIHVMEEGVLPPFAYSVGVSKTSHVPEVIVIGLKRPMAHFVVNDYNRRVRAGERFAAEEYYSGFLEGFDIRFASVAKEHHEEYLGWNRWLYGGDSFDTFQIVYPNTSGIWPWDEAAPLSFREWQPLLGSDENRNT